MKIPKKLKILGYTYKVRITDEADSGNDNLGTHWWKNQVIVLNSSLREEIMASTFLHEIIESVNYNMGLNLKHNQIVRLETGLYQILKENKIKFF
jgi:hypothetical protein